VGDGGDGGHLKSELSKGDAIFDFPLSREFVYVSINDMQLPTH
jgi:hypothetical protein